MQREQPSWTIDVSTTLDKPHVDVNLTCVLVLGWHAPRVFDTTHALQPLRSYRGASLVTRLTNRLLVIENDIRFPRSPSPHHPVFPARARTRLQNGLAWKPLRYSLRLLFFALPPHSLLIMKDYDLAASQSIGVAPQLAFRPSIAKRFGLRTTYQSNTRLSLWPNGNTRNPRPTTQMQTRGLEEIDDTDA